MVVVGSNEKKEESAWRGGVAGTTEVAAGQRKGVCRPARENSLVWLAAHRCHWQRAKSLVSVPSCGEEVAGTRGATPGGRSLDPSAATATFPL